MIKQTTPGDLDALAALALQLWPSHTLTDLKDEFSQTMARPNARFFLEFHKGQPVGFAQCQLRNDYVEGTDSSPVGYLEGIFVEDAFRGMGYARSLLEACQNWARSMGCREFASDCELENTASLRFHLASGFTEASRIICFVKTLSYQEE